MIARLNCMVTTNKLTPLSTDIGYRLFDTVNVYCPSECSPGGTIVHPGAQLKKFLPIGLRRDLVITLNATDT